MTTNEEWIRGAGSRLVSCSNTQALAFSELPIRGQVPQAHVRRSTAPVNSTSDR